MYDDAYTRNEDGELAVRTVNVTEGSNYSSYDDVFTRDTNGKLALRVTGSGSSSDSHNKGYYATQTALEEAYPTAEAGDWAIVGATDTVWIWDEDTSAWVDSDTKGQVVSVNSKTGTVVLTAEDVNAVPQYTTMPVASSTNANEIVQFVGATGATYTNGYFYKCESTTTPSSATVTQTAGSSLSDITVNVAALEQFFGWTTDNTFVDTYTESGWVITPIDFGVTFTGTPVVGDKITVVYTAGTVTYAWTRIDVQPTPEALPDQSGQNGKFLTTNGTTASWGTVESLPDQTGQSGKFLTTDGTDASWSDKPLVNKARGTGQELVIGGSSYTYDTTGSRDSTIINGYDASGGNSNVLIGKNATVSYASYVVAVGTGSLIFNTSNYAVAIGYGAKVGISSPYAIQLGGNNASNGDANTFKVANANGNFEIMSADGTIPEARLADTTNAAQGQVLTLDSNLNAVWQAGGGGSSYTAGTGIDITNDVISVDGSVLTNNADTFGLAAGTNCIVGQSAYYGVALGYDCSVLNGFGLALGYSARSAASYAIQLGGGNNYDANTFKVCNANGNFEIMSADGTVPTARLTKVNTTATLAAADWSSNTQTITVSGVKADSVVFVSPAPASASDYASAGILCTSQSADSLTFSCTQTPSAAIVVNIVCM